VNLFPTRTISLGQQGQLRFVGVQRVPGVVIGRFAVVPGEDGDWMAALRSHVGQVYAMLPGTWVSVGLAEDQPVVKIGVESEFGLAMARAHRALRTGADALIEPFTVKSLALALR